MAGGWTHGSCLCIKLKADFCLSSWAIVYRSVYLRSDWHPTRMIGVFGKVDLNSEHHTLTAAKRVRGSVILKHTRNTSDWRRSSLPLDDASSRGPSKMKKTVGPTNHMCVHEKFQNSMSEHAAWMPLVLL